MTDGASYRSEVVLLWLRCVFRLGAKYAFFVVLAMFGASEWSIRLRSRMNHGGTRLDRGSIVVVIVTAVLGVAAAFRPRAGVQSAGIRTARWPVFLIASPSSFSGWHFDGGPSSPWASSYGPGSGAQWSNGRRHRSLPLRAPPFVHRDHHVLRRHRVALENWLSLVSSSSYDDRTDHSDSCRRARPTQRARRAVPRVLQSRARIIPKVW